jgi:hypothetical protein
MAIHPSERRRNVLRTILVALLTADLAGATLVPDGDERAPGEDTASWVRVQVQELRAAYAGAIDGAKGTREDLLLVAECWCRGAGRDQVAQVDAVDAIAEAVAFAVRYRDLPLKDYVTDSTGGTAVSGVSLRFHRAPQTVRLDPLDGYQRRIVRAEFVHFSRHTG